MKKYLTLILIAIHFMASAQCPAPTNVIAVDNTLLNNSVELSWTETGTAIAWEVSVIPDYLFVTTPPSNGTLTSINPSVFTNLNPGCYVFYVRSICANQFSPWTMVASSGCSLVFYNYIASLSNEDFSLNSDKSNFQIYPNPTNEILKLNGNSFIDKVIISDFLGKIILVQTQNTKEINVESLSKGIYIIEAISGKETFFSKFIKE